jgi:hypothetical protein
MNWRAMCGFSEKPKIGGKIGSNGIEKHSAISARFVFRNVHGFRLGGAALAVTLAPSEFSASWIF